MWNFFFRRWVKEILDEGLASYHMRWNFFFVLSSFLKLECRLLYTAAYTIVYTLLQSFFFFFSLYFSTYFLNTGRLSPLPVFLVTRKKHLLTYLYGARLCLCCFLYPWLHSSLHPFFTFDLGVCRTRWRCYLPVFSVYLYVRRCRCW